ncbi:MAG: hypothetical protein ACOYXT_25440 [Bacteroidota bacterium]
MKKLLSLLLLCSSLSATAQQALISGPNVGEDCPAFDPRHVWGPDRGTTACPMCKYGYRQGVIIWMNTDDWNNAGHLVQAFEEQIHRKGLKRIRVFLVYMNPDKKKRAEVESMLIGFAKKNELKKVAVTYIPEPTDPKTAGLYDINPDSKVRNTVIVYKSRGVFEKFVNFNADAASIGKLISAIDKAEAAKNF